MKYLSKQSNICIYVQCYFLQPKVIRVLNLWQRNNVYEPKIIQPLLDLASDPENATVFLETNEHSEFQPTFDATTCQFGIW